MCGRERRPACWSEVERSSLDLLCMGCCAEKRRRGSGLWKGCGSQGLGMGLLVAGEEGVGGCRLLGLRRGLGRLVRIRIWWRFRSSI